MTHAFEYDPHTRVRTAAHPQLTRVHTPAHPGLGLERSPLLWVLVVGAGLVALVAMAASSYTLAGLGRAIGWDQWHGLLAWSLPVSADLLAAVAGVAWLAADVSDDARKLARIITIAAVTVSVVLNAVGHLVESGDLRVEPWLRIAVSTVPPIVAAVALHLVVTVVRDQGQPAEPAPTDRHQVEPAHQAPAAPEPDLPVYEIPAPLPAPVAEPVFTPAAEVHTEVHTLPAAVPADPAPPAAEFTPWWEKSDLDMTRPGAAEHLVPTPHTEVHTPTEEVHTLTTDEWFQSALTAMQPADDDIEVTTPAHPAEEVHTEVFTDADTEEELTPEARRELILKAAAEGLSQRKVAARASCSPAYVRKVLLDSAA